MKYENPNIEVVKFEIKDVIRTSLNNEGGGSGPEFDGDWSN